MATKAPPMILQFLTFLAALLPLVICCDPNHWWDCDGTFVVSEGEKGQKCLFARFDAYLDISYLNKATEKTMARVKLPMASSVQLNNSFCYNSTNTSSLDLTWNNGDYGLNLDFFQQVGPSSHWFLRTVEVRYNRASLANSSETGTVRLSSTADGSSGFFKQLFPLSYYYFCDSHVNFVVNNTISVTMVMSNARIFPFPTPQSATKWLCFDDAEKEGKLVPIIVGAIIAFLMLTIFVVYIVLYCWRKVRERKARRVYAPLGGGDEH